MAKRYDTSVGQTRPDRLPPELGKTTAANWPKTKCRLYRCPVRLSTMPISVTSFFVHLCTPPTLPPPPRDRVPRAKAPPTHQAEGMDSRFLMGPASRVHRNCRNPAEADNQTAEQWKDMRKKHQYCRPLKN